MLRFILLSILATIIGYWLRQLWGRVKSLGQRGAVSANKDRNERDPNTKTIDLSKDDDGVYRPHPRSDKKDGSNE